MLKKLFGLKFRGQSAAELAILTPVLIFILIGGVETGWALRSYLILGNVNREVARFAVRPGYLDYSEKDVDTVGYDDVLNHIETAANDQLDLDFDDSDGESNATLIIHHIVADMGYPCPYDADGNMTTCDCNSFTEDNPDGSNPFTSDDLILYPEEPGYEYYLEKYPADSTKVSTVNYDEMIDELKAVNNALNCKLLTQDPSARPTVDNMVITEIFYDHPQLLNFPLISNIANPIPIYSAATFRMADGDRDVTVGPTCAAMPITFNENIFGAAADNPPSNVTIDVYESGYPGNFGWLYWNPDPSATQGANTIADELRNPNMSQTDFYDAAEYDTTKDLDAVTDTHLSIGDHVDGRTGIANSNDVKNLLRTYIGKTVIIPVHDDASYGTGQNMRYHVTHFARVVIQEICLPGTKADCPSSDIKNADKVMVATFLEYADDACSEPVVE